MPENIYSIVIVSLCLLLGSLQFIRLLVKAIKNRYAPVKTVNAVIVGKNIVEAFSKYSGSGKSKKYVIVFSINGKKKSFYVSQFSYNGYQINEKGTLKYQGDRLISFS